MKILIDASNLKVGGAIQVSLSVIKQLSSDKYQDLDIYYVVSENVYKHAKQFLKKNNFEIITTDIKTIFPWNKGRRRIKELSESYDVIFTIFGPTYWGTCGPRHLIGFANPWIVSQHSIAYKKLNVIRRTFTKLKVGIQGYLLWDPLSYYVTETEAIRKLFIKKFNCDNDKIKVVPNCLNYVFNNLHAEEINDKFNLRSLKCIKFVTITHNYPHKNLSVIPGVYTELRKLGVNCKFIITINENDYEKQSDIFKSATLNLGPVSINDCPAIYKYCDILFLPTLLECFTASYLESMKMQLPICTSDLDFARTLCGNAAVYFNPLDAKDIAYKLNKVINDDCLKKKLLRAGDEVIKKFPDHISRVESYISIINGMNYVQK